MSRENELIAFVRQGGEARGRLRLSWSRLEEETGRLASDAGSAARKAASALKWGASAFLASAVLYRFVKFRRGFRGIRWLWSLGPLVARFALGRIVGKKG